MDSSEINQWIDHISCYRDKLDLATIIWHWKRLEDTDAWLPIANTIEELCSADIDETYRHFNAPALRSQFLSGDAAFMFDTHIKVYDRDLSEEEKWFCQYREHMEKLSQYEYYPDDNPYFIDYPDDENDYWPPEYKDSEYRGNPILGNCDFTQRFIDLDLLLDRMKKRGMYFPEELRQKQLGISENDISYSGVVQVDESLESNPFYLYLLTDTVRQNLWDKNKEQRDKKDPWDYLKEIAGSYTSPAYKNILGAIYRINSSEANSLRLFTQPYVMRINGSSGKDLTPMLRPLMRVMFIEGDISIAFWEQRSKKLDLLIDAWSIEPGEGRALLALAIPKALIDEDSERKAWYGNPGSTFSEIIVQNAEKLVHEWLPELISKPLQPEELKHEEQLKKYIEKMSTKQ